MRPLFNKWTKPGQPVNDWFWSYQNLDDEQYTPMSSGRMMRDENSIANVHSMITPKAFPQITTETRTPRFFYPHPADREYSPFEPRAFWVIYFVSIFTIFAWAMN
jgi:hypothetical protein